MAPRRRRPRANLLGTAVIVGLIGLSLVAAYPGGALVLAAVGGIGWALWHHFARRRGAAARTVLRERRLGYELADLDRLSGVEFEAWIAAVLEKADFEIQDLRAGGDFGVDVIAAYGGVRFGIQAKRYKNNVGNSAVQEANAGSEYHRCEVPVVVTQSDFTRAARAQAERMQPPCVLIGRAQISDLAGILKARARA